MTRTIQGASTQTISLPPPTDLPFSGRVAPGESVEFQGNITIYNDSRYAIDITVRFDLQKGFHFVAVNDLGYRTEFNAPMFSTQTLFVENGALMRETLAKQTKAGVRLLKNLQARV